MFERNDAEYLGYFIALYAGEMGEMGDIYLGHYKVFSRRPRSFWDHGELVADTVDGLCSTAKRAMEHAEDLAKQRILGLPSRLSPGLTTSLPRIRTKGPATRVPRVAQHSSYGAM